MLLIVSENLYERIQKAFPPDLSTTFLETEAGVSYSYSDLEQQTSRYAQFLTQQGLAPGDRVLVQAEKTPQVLLLCLACIRAGLVYLPLNTAYRKNEVRYIVSDAEPKLIVCDPTLLEPFEEIARELKGQAIVPRLFTLDRNGCGSFTESFTQQGQPAPPSFRTVARQGEDLAALLYTSGTTGQPKGAMLTYRNIVFNINALREVWRWQPADVLLHSLPIFHVHGLFVACLSALFSGTKIIYLPRFDPASVMRHLPRATVFMGVPTYFTRLLEEPDFGKQVCGNMRLFISGSAPLLEPTFAAFERRTGFPILERYGLTEAGVVTSNPVEGPRIAGTVGIALPGTLVRVADEEGKPLPPEIVGEVQVKGENVFAGYWRRPQETAASLTHDGFLKTGDLGRWREDGYLAVVGRSKEMIITGGLNVYPKEIETTLDQIEGIAESAVIGVPHPDFGEGVVALVARKHGWETLTESALIARLKEGLANYKVPKRIFFLDHLPRNAMGKVQKNLLRSQPEFVPTDWSVRSR